MSSARVWFYDTVHLLRDDFSFHLATLSFVVLASITLFIPPAGEMTHVDLHAAVSSEAHCSDTYRRRAAQRFALGS